MRKFLIGILVGGLLATASPTFAAIGSKLEAVYSNMNLQINGYSLPLDEPILIVNGNSYLPLKQIATLMGYEVSYNDKLRTINLNDTMLDYYSDNQYYFSVNEINENSEIPRVTLVTQKTFQIFYNGEQYPIDPILDYYYDKYNHEQYLSAQALSRLASPKINLETLKKYKINRENNVIYQE